MITIVTENYPGKNPRPWPQISEVEKNHSVALVTPWASQEAGQIVIDTVGEYFQTSMSDPEATSPFSRLPHLGKFENLLRSATYLANQSVYQRLNAKVLSGAAEMLLLSHHGHELVWTQVGQPHLLLYRNQRLFTLSQTYDLSFQFGSIPPLPSELIGINNQIEVTTKTLLTQTGDKLVAVARAHLPRSFSAANFGILKPEELAQALLNLSFDDSRDLPCWITVVDI